MMSWRWSVAKRKKKPFLKLENKHDRSSQSPKQPKPERAKARKGQFTTYLSAARFAVARGLPVESIERDGLHAFRIKSRRYPPTPAKKAA